MTADDDPIQDNQREKQLIELFGLHRFPGEDRNPNGNPDAFDDYKNDYECKATTKDKVSTARDFSRNHLNRYLRRYWLVGKGRNRPTGFVFDRIFFMAPSHLGYWAEKLFARFDHFDAIGRRLMTAVAGTDADVARQMIRRGSTFNDPGLPWNYVCQHGIEICSNHCANLRQLIVDFPITARPNRMLVASHLIIIENC